MKKNFVKFVAILFTATVSIAFVSCGDPSNDEPNKGNGNTPPSTEKLLSMADQKEFLEKTALEWMNKMPASDFREIAELGQYLSETYGENYNWESVNSWAEAAYKASREAIDSETETSVHTWEQDGAPFHATRNTIYTSYKALLLASNFTGRFTARDGHWHMEKADHLEFLFTDKQNQPCVLKLETSGAVKKVYALNLEEWSGYDTEEGDNSYIANEYYDRTQYTLGVPEKVVVSLIQGGKDVIKTTVNIDLGSIIGEEFDISKNSLSLSTLTELSNGYKFYVSQVAYTANTKVSLSFEMSKNGTTLLSMGVAADVHGLPSANLSAFSAPNFNIENYDTDKATAKNAFVKLDILGKVQLQGTVSEIRRFIEYLNQADVNRTTEATFKSYLNQANDLLQMGLFYDGKALKQAAIKLEPFTEEAWDGRTEWVTMPVLHFYDGSSYSTFEAFFNDKDFKNTLDAFKTLANKYAELVGERVEW